MKVKGHLGSKGTSDKTFTQDRFLTSGSDEILQNDLALSDLEIATAILWATRPTNQSRPMGDGKIFQIMFLSDLEEFLNGN